MMMPTSNNNLQQHNSRVRNLAHVDTEMSQQTVVEIQQPYQRQRRRLLTAKRKNHRHHGTAFLPWACVFLLAVAICTGVLLTEHRKLPVALQRPNGLRNLNIFDDPVSHDPTLHLQGTSMTASGNGYDTADGFDALCWRGGAARHDESSLNDTAIVNNNSSSPFDGFSFLGSTELLPDCSSQLVTVLPPAELTKGDILRIGKEYNFTIFVTTNLSNYQAPGSLLWSKIQDDSKHVAASVKIILCNVQKTGFCTPFVHEREQLRRRDFQPEKMESETHLDSVASFLTLEDHTIREDITISKAVPDLQANLTISMVVPEAGDYVAIAAVEMYTQDVSTPPNFLRWDIANAMRDGMGGRLLQFRQPPTILEVSPAVEIVSYVLIGVVSLVLGALLLATIHYRNSRILQLTQGHFLIAYLLCALVAVSSSFLFNPKSDVHCRYSSPTLLVSLQFMYAITAGRLWRIHAVLSPILGHRDSSQRPRASQYRKDTLLKRVYGLLRLPFTLFKPAQNGLRRSVSHWHLSLVIFLSALPQLLLQIVTLVVYPRAMVIELSEDGSIGRMRCDSPGAEKGGAKLLKASYVVFVVWLFFLLIVTFCCRRLPRLSVLNETRQIFDTTSTSMILLVLAMVIVFLTDNATTSPDVPYVVVVSVVLLTTLNNVLRIMYPKLKMAYDGETIVFSDLVNEHHRKLRQKEEAKMKELTDKAHSFQTCVAPLVQDRELNAESVARCFIAEEAIDALLQGDIVSSRWEGVQLGRLLERELGLLVRAGGKNEKRFQDGLALYRFREYHSTSRESNSDSNPDFFLMPRFKTRQQSIMHSRSCEEEITVVELYSFEQLKELADGFKSYVDVRNRKYRMKLYEMCFVASESIDSMLYAGLVKSRDEAVKLGLRFQKELNLFQHVSDDCDFCDDTLFFRYKMSSGLQKDEMVSTAMAADDKPSEMGESRRGRTLSLEANRFVRLVEVRDRIYHMRKYRRVFVGTEAVDAIVFSGAVATRWEAVQLGRALMRDLQLFKHVTGDHTFQDDELFYRYCDENVTADSQWEGSSEIFSEASQASEGSDSRQLAANGEVFQKCADVRDRRYHGVKYKSCFVASEVIDSLVYTGVVGSRQEAVKLGRKLSRELRLFHHVTNDHVFSDAYLFFRFRDTSGLMTNYVSGSDKSMGAIVDDEKTRADLLTTARAFRACAEVRDRKYRYQSYKQCFIGMDTIDLMVSQGLASSRKDAVLLGRQLARELNLFSHVCDDHDFCDAYVFFRFNYDADPLPTNDDPLPTRSFEKSRSWASALESVPELDGEESKPFVP